MPLIRENVTLAPLTYYKIGGPARYFSQPESTRDLGEIAAFLRKRQQKYFILGAGSNVLIDDPGFDGLILHTAKLERTLIPANDALAGEILEVGASVAVIQLLRHCMAHGISGFEFLVGIPGNLGGVMAMNAGTSQGGVDRAVVEITAFDLESGTSRAIPRTEIKYGYRCQYFLKPHEIILRGKLRGRSDDPKRVQDEVQKLLETRKKAQPLDKPSCGSVFKNPDPAQGPHAWKLIADAGLRGHRIGQAQISELHANFIVNLGGAKAADVKALIDEAKRRVQERSGIALEEEVRILAHDGGGKIL